MDNSLFREITVIILAGGNSTRLWPLNNKHLVKFLGEPLIHYSLQNLQKFGFKKIIIVVNSKNKSEFELLIDRYSGLNISTVEQSDKRGMAGAILSVKRNILRGKILIIKPSDLYENHIFYDFAKLLSDNPECILSGIKIDSYFPGGYFKFAADNKISGIVEKPVSTKLPSNIASIVFDYFAHGEKFIESLLTSTSSRDDLYEIAIDQLIKNHISVKLLLYKGYWGYLQYPWHVLNLSAYFLDKINKPVIKKGKISKNAVISGKVFIENDVTILENVKILGPCYIGRGTIVGNNSLIRESMIGNNCVIGSSTEIARSYIGDNCWFHTNYIGDSILMNNISLGSGAVLANLRLDEKMIKSEVTGTKVPTGKSKLGSMIGNNVRIGVNSSIMPGIKIGCGSFIGAGVVLDKDLQENKICFNQKSNFIIKDKKSVDQASVSRDRLRKGLKY